MKKRLIITSALMTCLLGASLATGTYAWYKVGDATVANNSAETTLTIPAVDVATSGALKLRVIVSEVTDGSVLQLSEYDATDASNPVYKYYTINSKGNAKLEYSGETGAVASKAYKVTVQAMEQTIEATGVKWTAAQVAEALDGKKVNVSVTSENTRMKFNAQTGSLADNVVFDEGTTTFNSAALTQAELTAGVDIGYIAVRVDGDNGANGLTPDEGNIDTAFTVTVGAEVTI